MSSGRAYRTLMKKEFRQNIVIYIFPLLIASVVLILIHKGYQLFNESFALKLAIAVPIAIALSFGVQSFDLEEKAQTRDFLIVKPISISQIIWIKYLTGLGMSLLGGLVWIFVSVPQIYQWPSLFYLKGFLLLAIILLDLIIYSISFLFGVLIKGPVKIIGAVIGSAIAALVFFGFWFELIKFLTWNNLPNWLTYIIFFAFTALEIVILYRIVHLFSRPHLQNQMFSAYKGPMILFVGLFLVFPAVFYGVNVINPPVIVPYDPFSLLINGDKGAFIAYQGAQCPQNDTYAVADYTGRLGLAESGKTPVAIYQSPGKLQHPLQDIRWSPDGSKILFRDQKHLRVWSVSDKKLIVSFNGAFGMWSRNSQQLLIAAMPANNSFQTNNPKGISLSLADFKTRTISNIGQLKSINIGLGWDSTNQTILAIDQTWNLTLINMKNGSIRTMELPKKFKEKPAIFLVRIIPPPQNKSLFLFQIFSTRQKHSFNIDLYDYNASNNSIIHRSALENVTFNDFIAASQENGALYSSVSGVYRHIKLPKAVK